VNPALVLIALFWIVVIALVIHAFLKPPRLDRDTPSPDRNSSQVTKDPGGKGGLLRYLTYSPMSINFNNEGFPEPRTHICISDYYFIPPFLYEAGAILGRARHDKIDVLRKMLHTTTSGSEDDIEKVLYRAKKRLEEYKNAALGREPQTFRTFVHLTELRFESWWCSLDIGAKVSPREVEPYILSLVLEGIVFGSLFPELTKKMNRNFYDSIEIDWDTWIPLDSPAPLVLPKHIFQLPGEPTILSLEGQEDTLLRVVGQYVADYHPELIDSLDLRHYQDERLMAWSRYRGWWRVYDTLLFSDKGAL